MNRLLAMLLSLFGIPALAGDLYTLIPPVGSEKLGRWQEAFPAYDEVVGYSALGHFLVRAKSTGEYAVIHPFKVAAKSYGVFPDVGAFEAAVLKEPGFQAAVLFPEHVNAIRKRLGPLATGEIYIPEPYPFLGGSEEPETYGKGNVWVFADILGEMVHLHKDG